MSDLDVAMRKHMNHIISSEYRPFTYVDFLSFEVDGREYGMKHGTFRNKMLEFKKRGEVELECNSGLGFYTLKGKRLMTCHHTRVSSNDRYRLLFENLSLSKNSIHDIRLRFKVHGFWSLIQLIPSYFINHISKDIIIGAWNFEDHLVRVTVHKTNTVSVVIGCTYKPIVTDLSGVILLSNTLTRVEERILALIDCAVQSSNMDLSEFKIPRHDKWIVTMWHFGADSISEHSGRDFHMSWETAESELIRAYTKDMKDNKRRIRIEKQEYPNKPLFQALEDKLNMNVQGYKF